MTRGWFVISGSFLCALEVHAQIYPKPEGKTTQRPALLKNIGIDQKMGAQVPLDIVLADEAGKPVTFSQFSGKPAILALVYYQCPSLCNLVLSGIVKSLRESAMTPGRDFNVIAVSFDPRDNASLAAAKKKTYLAEYDRPGTENGWHFLTGVEPASRALADSVGFHYAYDANDNQYVHPSAIMILTPEGRVARYLYGINYAPRDVRLGLVDATDGRIASVTDQILLYCFHYDPSKGKYGFVIMNVIRAGGILTLGLLGGFMFLMFRRDSKRKRTGLTPVRS